MFSCKKPPLTEKKRQGQTENAPVTRKQTALTKVLIKNTVLMLAVIGVLVLANGALLFLQTGYDDDQSNLSRRLNQTSQEINVLTDKLNKAGVSLPVYKRILEEYGGSQITLDRKKATELLQILKDKYALSTLKAGIGPLVSSPDASLKNQHMATMQSTITMQLSALTDRNIFIFLNDFTSQIKGKIHYKVMIITKNHDLERSTLQEISNGSNPALIATDIEFIWMGMENIENETPQ